MNYTREVLNLKSKNQNLGDKEVDRLT